MNKIKVYVIAAWIMVFAGVVMILLCLLGSMTNLSNYTNRNAQKWDRFDSSLPSKTFNLKSLQSYVADNRYDKIFTKEQIMNELYDIVSDRFTHGSARYNVFSNWLLYSMGKIHPGFSFIRDPDVLLRYGHAGNCGQQSYLLLVLAERFGIRSRHVGLKGHVVMEAWYSGGWHMYDPDLEVVPEVPGRGVISVEALSREPILIKTLYQERGTPAHVDFIIKIFTSREDNTFMSYPRLAQFEWKSNVLSYFELIANWLKWILPLSMLAAGGLIMLWWK